MKSIRFILTCIIACWITETGQAQENTSAGNTYYNIEAFGSAASGDNTPFWMISNRYGTVPRESGNGYMRAAVFHHRFFGEGFYWSAGIDALATTPRHQHVHLQQIYASIGYKNLQLSIGSKEEYNSLWDKRLSTGDMIQSANARPIPEIRISIPEFMTVPYTRGWFHLRGDMGFGRSFDTGYLEDVVRTEQYYVKNTLWHHKSLFVRLKDTRNDFPLYASFGLRHIAQWGGTSTNPKSGKQPQSLKDMVRIFFCKAGGADASASDQINVLGAHHITYDFQLGFAKKNWAIQAYYQHISADKSGILFYNNTDGLWGIQLDLHAFRPVRKILFEYMDTRDQSGPFHFISFDHDAHPGRGGGADNYYNNGEYSTGLSYFNQSIGSPLLPSPVYNTDGSLGFQNTRIRDWHIGLEGDISVPLSYRVLFTFMEGWGMHHKPFLRKKDGISFLGELNYTPRRLNGWTFTGSFAGDTGNILGDNSYGFSFSIKKTGKLLTLFYRL